MQTIEYDFLILIGRFQPFHKGHLAAVQSGLKKAQKIIVICGSAFQHRSVRNPWTFEERDHMIRSALTETERSRIHIIPIADTPFDDTLWANHIQNALKPFEKRRLSNPSSPPRIGLIQQQTEDDPHYSELFPQWEHVTIAPAFKIRASIIRNILFKNTTPFNNTAPFQESTLQQNLPVSILSIIEQFTATSAFSILHEEQQFLTQFKKSWEPAPYSPTFVTVDAIVVHNKHILLIERKNRPGKGLLALPGGFIDQHETLLNGCLRELQEETHLNVPLSILKNAMRDNMTCDAPYRSARGRTITHVFYMILPSDMPLPNVKGGDDAKRASWFSLDALDPRQLFEDHYFIIQEMTKNSIN